MITDGVAHYQCKDCGIVYEDVEELGFKDNHRYCANCNNIEFIVFIPKVLTTGVIGTSD
jgi:hypothetical protein